MNDLSAAYRIPKNWGWLLVWGIILIGLGIVAIILATTTTLISVMILGALLFVGGIVFLIDTFKVWWGKWGPFFLFLIMSILYLIAGVALMKNPLFGAISLTLFLAIFYIIIGIFRIIGSLTTRVPQWGWILFSGIVALVLGILILAEWPTSGLFIIGLFIGIELLVIGWAYVLLAFSARPSA